MSSTTSNLLDLLCSTTAAPLPTPHCEVFYKTRLKTAITAETPHTCVRASTDGFEAKMLNHGQSCVGCERLLDCACETISDGMCFVFRVAILYRDSVMVKDEERTFHTLVVAIDYHFYLRA